MRVKDKVQIAFWNLGAGKQMMKKMIFGMVFVFMIIFCFLMVMQSYFAYIEGFNQKHVTDCYYYSEIGSQELAENVIEGLVAGSHEMQEKYHAVETSVLCTLDLTEGEELLAAGNMGLILNGETCQAVNYYVSQRKMYQSIQGNSSPVSVGLYQPGMAVFADKITKEYGKGYLMGSYPERPGEIMLDTHILEVFGVENIEESLLGTKVSISFINEETEEIILRDYTLTGIFQAELLSYRESVFTRDVHLEHIYINLFLEDRERFIISGGSIRYYFHDYMEYVENYENMDSILRLNLAEVYESEDSQVKLTGKGMEYSLLYWIMDHIGKLLLLIAGVIGLIITFSVGYMFQFYRDRNARYFSMLQDIGMEKRDRRWIGSMEMGTIMLLATVLGIYLSAIFLLLLNMVTKQILDFQIVFDLRTGMVAVLASWVYFWGCMRIAMRKE